MDRNSEVLLESFKQVFKEMSAKPYSQSSMMTLSSLCVQMKTVGPHMEQTSSDQLDMLMETLTNYCKDADVDLEVRLQILELIEFKALGWKSNKGMEEFYIERFNDARKAKHEKITAQAATRPVVQPSPPVPVNTASPSANNNNSLIRRNMTIGSDELVLESRNRTIVQLARQQLETFFSRTSAVTLSQADQVDKIQVTYSAPAQPRPSVKYSRETLLTLATNPHAMDEPTNWNELKNSLPSVIIRRHG